MTIPASKQIAPLQRSSQSVQFVDSKGLLTSMGQSSIDSVYTFVTGCCRFIPCNASGTNAITLTMLSNAPFLTGYFDFDTFRFVAANTTSGAVTAQVVTPQGSLASLNVYKSNGSAQATAGDITAGLQYDVTFVDSLNSGAGGFVLR